MRRDPPRIIYVAHESLGRARFRLSWLRDHRDEAPHLAEALSDLDGVDEVQVRVFTGSVLVTYDPARIDVATIRAALCKTTGVAGITLPGHETPEQLRQILRGSFEEGSDLTRAAIDAFQGLNVDVLRATGGNASLGAMLSLSLWIGAAAKILGAGRIELPEWHQLLWWGFRSFTEIDRRVVDEARERPVDDLLAADGAAPADGHDGAGENPIS